MHLVTTLKANFVEVQEEDPLVPSYQISWKDYKEIINSLADSRGSDALAGDIQVKLCPGVVSMTPGFFMPNPGSRTVVIDIPEVRSDIRYHGHRGIVVYPNCIFPTTRMTLHFVRTSSSSTDHELKFSGMNLSMLHQGTIHRYPFPNVHNNGSVCWGSVSLPTFVSLKSLEGAPLYMAAFREANFNDDLTPYLKEFKDLHGYFIHLSTAVDFPYYNFV